MIYILPSCVIATIYLFYWAVFYPHEILDTMMFRDVRSAVDIVAGILVWLFVGLAVTFTALIAFMLQNKFNL